MEEIRFVIKSPPAPADLDGIKRALARARGVAAVNVDPVTSRVTIAYDARLNDTFGLVTAVRDAGYSVVTASTTLSVTGMTCVSCTFHVESALTDLSGVVAADVDLRAAMATVTFVADGVEWQALCQAVEEAGYQASVLIPAL